MAQVPLVLQLQQLATDDSTAVTELLRKALLVATKLDLKPFREWVNQELRGFAHISDAPAYRRIRADLRAHNPYHGLIPYMLSDNDVMDTICNVTMTNPVGSLVDLLSGSEDGFLTVSMPPAVKQILMENQRGYVRLEPVLTVGRNQVAAILDAVRTVILDWSLQLESDGVLGEGMTFTSQEKQKALHSVHIENFQGVFGDVSGSKLTQNLQMVVKKGDFPSLRKHLEANKVSPQDINELENAIKSDPTPTALNSFGKATSGWIGNMVGKASTGAWDISVGAAGGFLGDALATYFGLS